MSENMNIDMKCTEGKNGEVSCKITASENGKQATCTLNVAEVKNGASFNLSCSGDKGVFKKIEDSDMFVHKDGKDFHLQK